ncbi:hypothetical protein LNP04_07045 [Chryseobacterium sp. C-71]|uniref:hypothetical protein n=1 Tax=Chryseobacterium sp. C-71 TaxID=2893882 RepID=UPI001E5E2274|nr:hypothetical protein [Chryseobacterium sp. C-71]UFH33457.1 hypothetical protein LNP04_07045 [Chryseobacterium sp. C-71]
MKFNFFRPKKTEKNKSKSENIEADDFTTFELAEYDKNVKFYYTNIINSLVLFAYNSKQLLEMESILIDPITELYEELQDAFVPVCFDTVFRNNFIDSSLKKELLEFKFKVEQIPNEIWDYSFIDNHEIWKSIKEKAEELLSKLNIKSRTYNTDFTTIISKDEEVLFQGKKDF